MDAYAIGSLVADPWTTRRTSLTATGVASQHWSAQKKFARATHFHLVHIRADLFMVLFFKVDALSPECTDLCVPLALRHQLRFRRAGSLPYER